MIFYIPLIVLLSLVILFGTFFVVKQQSAAVIERFGKFTSIRQSGLQLKIPIIDRVAGRLSLRIQQLDVVVETKTKDDVFVKIKVSVQFMVIKEKVYDAFYKLDYPNDQITSYVFDVDFKYIVDCLRVSLEITVADCFASIKKILLLCLSFTTVF